MMDTRIYLSVPIITIPALTSFLRVLSSYVFTHKAFGLLMLYIGLCVGRPIAIPSPGDSVIHEFLGSSSHLHRLLQQFCHACSYFYLHLVLSLSQAFLRSGNAVYHRGVAHFELYCYIYWYI